MIDRIFRGFVVDMIDFNGLWHFVFNVADMYVHINNINSLTALQK